MNWKLYEHKVLERFREIYPNSEILYNTSIKGIKSGRSRQIDTLLINRVGRTEDVCDWSGMLPVKFVHSSFDYIFCAKFWLNMNSVPINNSVLIIAFVLVFLWFNFFQSYYFSVYVVLRVD